MLTSQKKSVVKILDRAWTGLKPARTDSPGQWICRSTNGELAESIKRSASDRLVEPVPQDWARTFPGAVILQNFGVVLISVFSVVKGFTEIKKTPKQEKCIEWSRQHPPTPKFKLNRKLRDRSPPKFWRTENL